jgi:hypothetical protein
MDKIKENNSRDEMEILLDDIETNQKNFDDEILDECKANKIVSYLSESNFEAKNIFGMTINSLFDLFSPREYQKQCLLTMQ